MDRFTAMLAKLGFRGSSDDDLAKGQRSAHSTPRMSRSLVRDPLADGRRFGSLGSMENYRVKPRDPSWESERLQGLNRSWDLDHVALGTTGLDRVPGGCDRSWEMERARGLELLQQSMEREKERRRSRGRERNDRSKSKKKKKHRDHSQDLQLLEEHHRHWLQAQETRHRGNSKGHQAEIDAQKLSRERLERRAEELNRQLLEEKQLNRRDKLMVARLQRDMARQKSEGPLRETLMKELERERMLRVDAEQRLREMTIESDSTKSRLKALQDEFKQMEEMVQNVMQYKRKIDELKQEKTTMMINYENNLQKYRTQISTLEHENKILDAEVNKLESQHQSLSPTDDSEKSKVLLERLKMMEAEKTGLVLENENQRQQYEKCLDEIANQVVGALMSQKTLREECAKLQRRVLDLEEQNRQLNHMFQQRIRFASDSVLQSLSNKGVHLHRVGDAQSNSSSNSSSNSLPIPPAQGAVALRGASHSPHQVALGDNTASPFSEISLESLQSMCSDYNEQMNCEESLGKPELSSPPPWLKDKLYQMGSPTSSIASPTQHSLGSPNIEHPVELPHRHPHPGDHGDVAAGAVLPPPQRADSWIPFGKSEKDSKNSFLQNPELVPKIETEFPATNSSPKMKHVGVIYQHKHYEVKAQSPEQSNEHSLGLGQSGMGRLAVPPPPPGKPCQGTASGSAIEDASPGQELLKLTDSFHEKYTINQHDGLPQIHNMLDSDSDSDSPSQCQSQHYSVASTMSLNELLECGLDEIQTPTEEHFSSDNFGFGESEEEDKDDGIEKALNMGFQDPLLMKECEKVSVASSPQQRSCSCQTSPSLDEPCELCVAASTASSTRQGNSLVSLAHRPNALPLSDCDVACLVSNTSPAPVSHGPLSATMQRPAPACETVLPVASASTSQLNDSQLGAHLIKAAGCSPTQALKVRPPVKPKPVKKPPAPDLACVEEGVASSVTQHIQKQASADSAHHASPGFSQSSTSPDSAMQQSFSSSSSSSCDTTTGDKPGCRDDGYSSQSAVSITNGDSYTLSLPPVAGTSAASCSKSFSSPQKLDSRQCGSSGLDDTDSVKGPEQHSASVRDIRAYFEGRVEEMKVSTDNVRSSPHHGARAKQPPCPGKPSTSVALRNGATSQVTVMRWQQLSSGSLSHSDSCIYKPKITRVPRPSGRKCACQCSQKKRTWQWRARAHSDTDIHSSPGITISKKQPPPVPKRPPSVHLKPKPYPKPTTQILDSGHVTNKLPNGTVGNQVTHKVPNGTTGSSHMSPRGHMMSGEVFVGHVMLQEGVPNLASYGLPSLSYGGTALLGDGTHSSPHKGKKLLEMRETCEGSESGYKSEDSLRLEALGSESNLACYESIPQGPLHATSGVQMGHLTVARQPQMSWMVWSSDSDGEEAAPVNYVELWRTREAPALSLPEWDPKRMASSLKQSVTPSPLSTKKMDGSLTSEQWLLGFSKADIEKHTSPERSFPKISTPSERSSAEQCASPQLEGLPCADGNKCPWISGSSFGNEIVYMNPESSVRTDGVKALTCSEQVPHEAFPAFEGSEDQGMTSEGNRPTSLALAQGRQPVLLSPASSKIVSPEAKQILEDISKCRLGLPKQSSLSRSLEEFEREYEDLALCDNFQQHREGNSAKPKPTEAVSIECMDISPDVTPTESSVFSSALRELCPTDGYAYGLPGINSSGAFSTLTFDWSPVEEDSGFEAHENEREPSDISRQIADLTRTVDDLQRSLSSLDAESDVARRYSSSSDGEVDLMIRLSPSDFSETQLQDPKVRANILDEMMISSSSDDEHDGDGGDPARGLLSRLRHKRRRKKVSKLEAVRQVSRPRPVVDYKSLYVRYSDPERCAMDSFSFLDDYPSSGTPSEDETGHRILRSKGCRGHGRGTTIKLGCGILEQVEHQNTGDGFGLHIGRDSSEVNKRSSNSSDELTKAPRLKPQHKTVMALKEESRQQGAANRLSSASFESQVSYGGLSLSDSCCESFSSSSPSINNVTFL